MNIFYISSDPLEAAQMLCDQHVRKMQIESAQMLCAAHWENGSSAPYKRAHINHPSTKWARTSIQNYRWLVKHGLEVCKEFTKRYNKIHKTQAVLEWLQENEPNLPNILFTPPPQCMPDDVKNVCTIQAFRNYYNIYKSGKKITWKFTSKPEWYKH